jgi:hypothetical protein
VLWLGCISVDGDRLDPWPSEGRADGDNTIWFLEQCRDLVGLSRELFAVLTVGGVIHDVLLKFDHLGRLGALILGDAHDRRVSPPHLVPVGDLPGMDGFELLLGEAGHRIGRMHIDPDGVVADDPVVEASLFFLER